MKVNILTDDQMREIGFTDYRKGYWYFCRGICRNYDITINFTINKKTGKCEIDILDENFLQPYNYYKENDEIYNNAKKWVDYLIDNGILSKNIKYL